MGGGGGPGGAMGGGGAAGGGGGGTMATNFTSAEVVDLKDLFCLL